MPARCSLASVRKENSARAAGSGKHPVFRVREELQYER